MKMTAGEVASWVDGMLELGRDDMPIEGISIDSRTLEAGSLFVAIVGPHHDGHRFVDQALDRGAAGVVVSSSIQMKRPAVRIRVSDTTKALQELAASVRRRAALKVVAITGSMGKTTTKEATAIALGARYQVLKSEKNFNNLYGVPLSILKHRDEGVAVLELGMSSPGEIARLTEIVDPDVGVLTNVAEVHREFFPSVEAIACAKGELFDGLGGDSVAVVNADDPHVLEQARRFSGRKLLFGFDKSADVRADKLVRRPDGVSFVVHYRSEAVPVQVSLLGKHNVYNLLAALAVAAVLDVPLTSAAAEFSSLGLPRHRGERIRFRGSILVIDETYNSNPTALTSVLDSFGEEEAPRRIAVLGDMLELGERAVPLHLECGRIVATAGVDLLIAVGSLSQYMVEGARRAGMPEDAMLTAGDAVEAGRQVAARLEAGDVVLFKASRSIGLDRAIEVLRERIGEESA